jgi:hypothetical protein
MADEFGKKPDWMSEKQWREYEERASAIDPRIEMAPAASPDPALEDKSFIPYDPNMFGDLDAATITETVTHEDMFTGKVGYGDISGLIHPFDGKRSKDPLAGLDNTQIKENVPKYNKAHCEKMYKGDNNTWIILGRDRPMGWSSGYGGKGHTRAGAIDIVVGIQGFAPNHKQSVEKNFGSMGNDKPGDAARIYISQRADIDNYFDICDGSVGNSKAMSAIGIKADSVRIMGRRGIKIVTGQSPQQKTSLGGSIPAQFGIDLIAGNRDSVPATSGEDPKVAGFPVTMTQPYLQPIPKGLNLKDCLTEIFDAIGNINSILQSFLSKQMIINVQLAGSPIISISTPVPVISQSTAITVIPASVMDQLANDVAQLAAQSIELNAIKADYLLESGPIYINSRFNRTN